jgi:hypothetical protein
MSDPEKAGSQPADQPDLIVVRKSFEVAGFVVGRPMDAESPVAEVLELEPELIAEDEGAEEMPEESAEPDTGSFSPARRSLLTIQRPVVYSGPSGFYENETVQSLLWRLRKKGEIPGAPHVTIAKRALVRQILSRREGVPVNQVESECREAVDELPDRRYAKITGAKAANNTVMLDLDWHSRGILLKDVQRICEHFGVPLNKGTKASFYPHVTVMTARKPEAAQEIADELDTIIQGSGGEPEPGEVRPTAIGFGMPNVIVTR